MPDAVERVKAVLGQVPSLLERYRVLVNEASTVHIETRKAIEDAERSYSDRLRIQDENTKAQQKGWKADLFKEKAAQDERLRVANEWLHQFEQEIAAIERDLETETGVVLHIMPAAHKVRL